jgi:N-acetylmuramoyl-L-alanine amidase
MPSFSQDSALVAKVVPSPNHDDRGGIAPNMIILHYTGMRRGDDALRRLCEPASKVSSHYLIFEDGLIVQLVPEARRAWHAGVSFWKGETDINRCSIGIEIVNPGHDLGYPDYPAPQIEAVIALCSDITARHRVPAERVLAHSDIAPSRKNDPGEKFPWQQLGERGVGVLVVPAPITADASLKLHDQGDAVIKLQQVLAAIGYDLAATGCYDQPTVEVVTAFQRHFRPQRVDGVADVSTVETLRSLIARLDQIGS